jgi:DNA (cytosine-5)-methyltransferase 1
MTLLPEKILSGEVEAPDLFCGGTPCQAFSVAGLRNSLDDARGNLSLTFVGIANAIDHVRSVRRAAPAIVFWENVPGVLNTKDNAFGCFLGALAGEDEAIVPPGEKWTNSGCVFGPQRTVAWRVLDAQYFGVAQRRRRVFVVASARDDFNPAEVLFEFEGVRRDTAPSRKSGQEVAGTIAARFGISRNNHEECVATTVWPSEIAPTLTSDFGDKLGQNNQHIDSQKGGFFVPSQVFENHGTDSRVKPVDVCPTVTSRWGTGGNNVPLSMQPIAFTTEQTPKFNSDQALTLTKSESKHNQCVAQSVAFNIAPGKGELKDDIHVTDAHVSKTIDASGSNPTMHQGGAAIVQTMAVRRLTPTECERLQGFPDGYTNIPWRKASEAPDGPRYKALGNSWAVPVVAWIGKRIQERITT